MTYFILNRHIIFDYLEESFSNFEYFWPKRYEFRSKLVVIYKIHWIAKFGFKT